MKEDDVIELVAQDASDLFVLQLTKELGIDAEHKVVGVLVKRHTRSGQIIGDHLTDVPRDLSKEGRLLQQLNEMPIDIEIRICLAEHESTIPRDKTTFHNLNP